MPYICCWLLGSMVFVLAVLLVLLLLLCCLFLEYSAGFSMGMCLLALNINKAYDQVSRPAMDTSLSYLGITAIPFYRLYIPAHNSGPV